MSLEGKTMNRLRASWCVCSWRSAPWCLLDNLLACRVRWVCDRHDRSITGGQ